MKKIVAIDGNSIMNRAFYGIMHSKFLVTKDGTYTNAIYGFLNILFKLLNDVDPDYVCVAFDLKAPTFRHKKYDQYKATRHEMPDELRQQMPIIKDILKAMNITIYEQEGYEADDILGTIAKFGDDNNIPVLLLTGDRDSLQLASKNVTIRIPITKMGNTESTDYTPEVIQEMYGIKPEQFIQTKGLMGDKSDNIPGVPGIGEKTAFSLIHEYQNIDNIYMNLECNIDTPNIKGKMKENLINNKELAYLSLDLGTIYKDVPIEFELEKIKRQAYNTQELHDLFLKLQFKTFIEKLQLTGESRIEVVEYEKVVIKDLTDDFDISKYEVISYCMISGLSIYDGEFVYYTKSPNYELLKNIFESSCLKVGCREKEDYLALKRKSINPNNMMFDLEVASYILNPTKDSYKLEDIIFEELNVTVERKKEEVQIQIGEIAQTDDKEYYADLTRYMLLCKEKLEEQLKSKNEYTLFNEIEMPLSRVLAEMEFTGVFVDRAMLEEYSRNLNKKTNELMNEIWNLAGEEFNINSPRQLGDILFDKLKLPTIKKNKIGYSTDVDVLEKIRDEHPIVEKILEYRSLSKLRATYVDGLIPLINDDTKRIHAKFNQTVTATGRISCTDPNLQNIPIRTDIGRELRKIFIAQEGSVLLDADYSQIELRVLAHMSNDSTMIKAFNDGEDIHRVTASQVFDVTLEEVTKQMRSEAKAVNFGIVYGISDFGLASNVGTSRKKAKEYIEKYFEKYPDIKKYLDNVVKHCKENGYVETLWGRRRYVPEIKSNNFNVRQFGERVAMNAPIQGTAADIIKIAMINIQKDLEKNNLKSRLIIQVHDELVIEAKLDEVDMVKQILINDMESVAKLKVPLLVEAQTGKTWYEAH